MKARRKRSTRTPYDLPHNGSLPAHLHPHPIFIFIFISIFIIFISLFIFVSNGVHQL